MTHQEEMIKKFSVESARNLKQGLLAILEMSKREDPCQKQEHYKLIVSGHAAEEGYRACNPLVWKSHLEGTYSDPTYEIYRSFTNNRAVLGTDHFELDYRWWWRMGGKNNDQFLIQVREKLNTMASFGLISTNEHIRIFGYLMMEEQCHQNTEHRAPVLAALHSALKRDDTFMGIVKRLNWDVTGIKIYIQFRQTWIVEARERYSNVVRNTIFGQRYCKNKVLERLVREIGNDNTRRLDLVRIVMYLNLEELEFENSEIVPIVWNILCSHIDTNPFAFRLAAESVAEFMRIAESKYGFGTTFWEWCRLVQKAFGQTGASTNRENQIAIPGVELAENKPETVNPALELLCVAQKSCGQTSTLTNQENQIAIRGVEHGENKPEMVNQVLELPSIAQKSCGQTGTSTNQENQLAILGVENEPNRTGGVKEIFHALVKFEDENKIIQNLPRLFSEYKDVINPALNYLILQISKHGLKNIAVSSAVLVFGIISNQHFNRCRRGEIDQKGLVKEIVYSGLTISAGVGGGVGAALVMAPYGDVGKFVGAIVGGYFVSETVAAFLDWMH